MENKILPHKQCKQVILEIDLLTFEEIFEKHELFTEKYYRLENKSLDEIMEERDVLPDLDIIKKIAERNQIDSNYIIELLYRYIVKQDNTVLNSFILDSNNKITQIILEKRQKQNPYKIEYRLNKFN